MDAELCPRCGGPVHWSGRGRRAHWCSPACRRAAYEERRPAASGAIAVRIGQREDAGAAPPMSTVCLGYTHDGHPHPDTYRVQSG